MHLQCGGKPVIAGRHDVGEACFLDGRQDPLGPERPLERLDQQAAVQLGLGISQLVVFGIDDTHVGYVPCVLVGQT